VAEQGLGTDAGPGKGCAEPAAPVVQPHLAALVHLDGCGLGCQPPTGSENPGGPPQQGHRVSADADVAVDEQGRGPAAFAGQGFEDGPAQGRAAAGYGPFHHGRAHVHPERPVPSLGQRSHESARAAVDVRNRAAAPGEDALVGGIRVGAPAFDVQGQQPAVVAAQEERAVPGAQRPGIGLVPPGRTGCCSGPVTRGGGSRHRAVRRAPVSR
jgi:hypothetical protein